MENKKNMPTNYIKEDFNEIEYAAYSRVIRNALTNFQDECILHGKKYEININLKSK